MAIKIKPLGDRVLVKPADAEEVSSNGIIIPDSAKEKPQEATVVAVGPGKTRDDGSVAKMNVKNGDKIIYGKYAGTELKFDGDEYLLLREDDILGIIG